MIAQLSLLLVTGIGMSAVSGLSVHESKGGELSLVQLLTHAFLCGYF